MAWKWYTEIDGVDGATSTTEFSGTLTLAHLADLSDNPQDNILYYAEIEEDPGDNQIYQQQDLSLPGTNQITISIVDDDPGNGHESTEVTLALTAAALDTNTAGASLDLGTTLLSGVSEAVPVHVRVENAVTGVGTSTELQLSITSTVDSEV